MDDSIDTLLADGMIVPECVYRPGSFTGLMTLYESNYIKLRGLSGAFNWPETMVSSAPRDRDLFFELVAREAYTTTVKLTYRFDEPGGVVNDPDLILRIYHDARLVEAVAGRARHHHVKLRELDLSCGAELGRRWRINMMLNKWLDYLTDVGHTLDAAVSPTHRRAG
jgi:uncharacterized protein YqiB (DUF1249 family)